ncbi:MAG: hypothetical protein H0U85_02950 [Gemmatimonadales bacterium]|nr:hypothetical protein [Gemmatimonadales bacterium]
MAGPVFHPGHEDLHGITVLVAGKSGRSYVGRYHEQAERGVVMHDVGVHDPASESLDRQTWLARQLRFGVKVDHKHFIVPSDEVGGITRLADLS